MTNEVLQNDYELIELKVNYNKSRLGNKEKANEVLIGLVDTSKNFGIKFDNNLRDVSSQGYDGSFYLVWVFIDNKLINQEKFKTALIETQQTQRLQPPHSKSSAFEIINSHKGTLEQLQEQLKENLKSQFQHISQNFGYFNKVLDQASFNSKKNSLKQQFQLNSQQNTEQQQNDNITKTTTLSSENNNQVTQDISDQSVSSEAKNQLNQKIIPISEKNSFMSKIEAHESKMSIMSIVRAYEKSQKNKKNQKNKKRQQNEKKALNEKVINADLKQRMKGLPFKIKRTISKT